ncbi:glycosyltransferase family 4 protein [Halomonas sp. G11]|uniref:glycosyltransferase family 4 protein n=1 Tax=Halomonas sp. G11 TaxID=1684425 RepID=UPI0009EDE0BC|nr:glycosyltransferase family 4 protein [Halomonas sp. G11]
MKLLLVSHSSGLYGAEKSLLTVAKGLVNSGHDVSVVIPSNGKLKVKLDEGGIPVIVWKYYGWLGKRHRALKGFYRLVFNFFSCLFFCLVNRVKVDVVYTNTVTTPFGVFYSFFKRKKHVWHVREFVHEDMGAEFDLPKKMTSRLYFINHCYSIFNSSAVSKKFNQYFGFHSSSVIYNAIEGIEKRVCVEPRNLERKRANKILMVSSLHEGKGHLDALNALTSLLKTYPDLLLTIVGSGNYDYTEKLINFVSENGLECNVDFKGYVDNPIELMVENDIFLMCSRNEAFGRVTLEAMSVGCPVIGANSGGTPEILGYGKYGVLYNQYDVEDLSQKVISLLESQEEKERLTQIGPLRAKDFSCKVMIDKINYVLTRFDSNL